MSNITVHFATNRTPKGSPPTGFGNGLSSHEGLDLRFGSGQVRITGSKPTFIKKSLKVQTEALYAPTRSSSAKATPERFALGSEDVFNNLRGELKACKRDAVAVIHGFANSFESGLTGAASVLTATGLEDWPVFAFCWPSNNHVTQYFPDRKDARRSGEAGARAIRKLASYLLDLSRDEMCRQSLHLVTHSMGGYVLRAALQALRREDPALTKLQLFGEVLMVASDEDADALEHEDKLLPLARMARRVTVYHTYKDRPLWFSDALKFNPDRLGARGPSRMSMVPENVVAVDVSQVVTSSKSDISHNYHRTLPAAAADLAGTLKGVCDDRPDTRRLIGDRRFELLNA